MAAELTKAEQNALCASYDVMGTHVELDLPFVKKYLVRGRSELVSDQEIVFFMNTCKQLKLMMCEELGATEYLSGTGAAVYHQPEEYAWRGVDLVLCLRQ